MPFLTEIWSEKVQDLSPHLGPIWSNLCLNLVTDTMWESIYFKSFFTLIHTCLTSKICILGMYIYCNLQILHMHIGQVEKQPLTAEGSTLMIRCKNFLCVSFIIPRERDCQDVYQSLLAFSHPGLFLSLICVMQQDYIKDLSSIHAISYFAYFNVFYVACSWSVACFFLFNGVFLDLGFWQMWKFTFFLAKF